MPYIDQKTAEELEALGHLLSDEIHEEEPSTPTTSTTTAPAATEPTTTPTTTVPTESLAEAEARADALMREGKIQEALRVRNAWIEQNGTYEGKPETPSAPTPVAPAPELTVDQIHAAIQAAEANGEWMKSLSLKNQLLQRGNR
jgi:hypothetical protein